MTRAYKLDKQKKIITVDDSVKQSQADQEDIRLYVLAGYEIRHKSKAKSKEATKRADTITADTIRLKLSADKDALKEFERLNKENGFFTARQYYRDYIASHTEAEDKPKVSRRTKKTATEETATATATAKTEE